MPWLVGHDLQGGPHRPLQVHPLGQSRRDGELDELYDLDADPFELENLNDSNAMTPVRDRLRGELRQLVADALAIRR